MMTFMLVLLTMLLVVGLILVIAVGVWRALVRWDKGMVRARGEIMWRSLFPARSLTWAAQERRCLNRMRSCVTVSVGGVSVVPSAFRIGLHPNDLARLEGISSFVEADLAGRIASEARRHRWRCDALPVVTLSADLSAQQGFPQVEGSFTGSDGVGRSNTMGDSRGRSLTDPLPRTPTMAEALAAASTEPWSLTELISLDGPEADFDMSDLAGTLILGRGRNCDVTLVGPTVSDEQAMLRRSKTGWEIEDLGSRNGTFRNGQRITGPVLLVHGDHVSFSKRGPRFRYAQLKPQMPEMPARSRRTSR